MRTFGKVEFLAESKELAITCEPHAMIRLKGVFPRINKFQMGTVRLLNTPRACLELLWFCELYPLEMAPELKRQLQAGRREHEQVVEATYKILSGDFVAREFRLGLTPRRYQEIATELVLRRRATLITDEMGLGKTLEALAALSQAGTVPALVVMKPDLLTQWERETKRILPGVRVHCIRGRKLYQLPTAEIYLIGYSVVSDWSEALAPSIRSVIFDEAHWLRHRGTARYAGSQHLARTVEANGGIRCALTGSPIYNYGDDMFSILDLIEEGCLGDENEFYREWCGRHGQHWKITDTKAFGRYLLDEGLMLRRSRKDVGIELPKRTRIIETVAADKTILMREQSSAIELAKLPPFLSP